MMSTTLDTQGRTSPMMMQWCACKKQVGSALLLFRLGDFYEAFDLDAEILARELELTLTKRQDIPMAGIPAHTSEAYIDKLVAKGYHVAIAEQVEDPKVSKGLVKREIVRVVTPGTLIHSSLLADKSPNFVGYLVLNNHTFGLSLLDITTAECLLLEWEDFSSLCSELVRLQPKELLLTEKVSALYQIPLKELQEELQFSVTVKTERPPAYTYEFLTEHFGVRSLDCFGVEGMSTAIHAAGSLLLYVQDELHMPIHHIRTLRKENLSTYMSLDATTLRHLEILEPLQDRDGKGTLLHHLDQTKTPMGGRLLRHWLSRPLLSSHAIFERQEAIACLLSSAKLEPLRLLLHTIRDLERLIMKMETGFGGPKELVSLRLSLEAALQTLTLLQGLTSPLLQEQASKLCDLSSLVLCLQQSLVDNPPLRLHDGPVIREGYSAELDTLRNLCQDSHSWIAQYQTRLREETNIKTLKVSYTRAFGYYIEVSRAQAERMPASFQRRQTLVNAERFITQELKEYEYNVLSAEEKISGLEAQLFQELRIKASSHAKEILAIASAIAHVDCLASLAKISADHAYTRPLVDEGTSLIIEEGRHPVIETHVKVDHFIPNNTLMDADTHRLLLITGPNMAGKSTFIRQVALIVLLAQIGSFVPAKRVQMGLIDKLFTRIGASDNLSRGQSTFMVEMTETANILHNVTDRSLVILDEIGRGTSTYDGISIAWAVAEYLLTTKGRQAKTLFATHYCELTQLEEKIPGAVNYHVAVHESERGIVFLRKILRGGTDKSYGIHVATLAGLPLPVLQKAQEILKNLERQTPQKHKKVKEEQLSLPLPPPMHPLLQEMKALDLNTLSPLDALQKLFTWKQNL